MLQRQGQTELYHNFYRVRQSFLVKGQFGNICKFFKSLQNVGFSSVLATEVVKGNPLRIEPDDNVRQKVRQTTLVNIHENAIFQ